uniref:Uncharacterized protein n=1 Tax=Nelumbo nucifera TaxID=4432 RepID=A0A822YS40_NELNU|nr:TPA_asm: hypothetical protein HUJ06_012447 [Nelumbo nucifera]
MILCENLQIKEILSENFINMLYNGIPLSIFSLQTPKEEPLDQFLG